MSADPNPRDIQPLELEVEPGTHWWCTCGRTDHPPFCDGSHKGTGRQPVKFETTSPTTVRWCRCEPTGEPPSGDGSQDCG